MNTLRYEVFSVDVHLCVEAPQWFWRQLGEVRWCKISVRLWLLQQLEEIGWKLGRVEEV